VVYGYLKPHPRDEVPLPRGAGPGDADRPSRPRTFFTEDSQQLVEQLGEVGQDAVHPGGPIEESRHRAQQVAGLPPRLADVEIAFVVPSCADGGLPLRCFVVALHH